MATVNKNFRVKNGLIVEGGSATVNGFDVLTKAQADQDYIVGIIGGTATSANTANTVVKRDANGNFAAGTITATFTGNLTGDVTGTVSSLANHDTADLAENATNKYFTDARAISATAASYDVIGAAAAAQSAATAAAATDATTKANAAQAAAISAAATDATTKANAAQAAAEATAAAALSSHSSDTTNIHGIADTSLLATTANVATAKSEAISAAATDATTKANAAQAAAEATAAAALSSAISTEVSNRNTAISTAVDSLVDGAPALLNTLNELAAAINDDANYTTTITTALGTKAPLASPELTGVPTAPTAAANTDTTQIATTAFAKAEADAAQAAAEATAAADATSKVAAEAALRVSGDAASVSTAAADATSKANAAQAAAISAAATDATTKANAAQAAAEATAAAANTAQQNGTTSFTAINYNDVAKQVAATTGNIVTAAATTAISWVAADYRSAKFVVKVKNGVHTQVSDLVVTLDTANNVAVSEYGITYSNGTELAAVTADYSGSDVRIRVTPANANTEVFVVGTLIK